MGIGPYGEKGKHPQPPGPAAQSGAFAARVRGRGGDCGRDHPQRGHQPRAIPQSRRSRDSSLCTREPWGTGDADCRVALLLAMTVLILCHSEEAQRADVGIRPFYDGRGFGPPHERRGERHAESSCPTESPINHPGQRRTAERLRQRVRGMDGNRRKDHPKRRTAAAIARAALSEAESAERAAGQIWSLPDDLRVQHGVQGSETCEKPRPCSRRGYAD